MRRKEEILGEVGQSTSAVIEDEGVHMEINPSSLELAQLEILIDIRDQLTHLNEKIPTVRTGMPISAPPPKVV